jgi:squalene-hopene/tetraprenyl-beta-curcumene cyclase
MESSPDDLRGRLVPLGDSARRPLPRGEAEHARTQTGADPAWQLDRAIERARDGLLARQHPEGYWCGELEGDTILESEYILLLAWLGRENSPLAQKAARYIHEKQLPEGGWALFPSGPAEISGSVKAYFALKLCGYDPESEPMRRARRAVLAGGGADAVNSFTRFYLALLGQIAYDHCPAVPPEAVLLPTWLPANIYRVSAWSRTILVPLSVMWAFRPVRQLPAGRGIAELFVSDPGNWPAPRCPGLVEKDRGLSWHRFFLGVDRFLKGIERRGITPFRKQSLEAAERWMTLRFAGSDGLGAIFPPIIWSVVALKCLGYSDESAEVRYCHEQLEALAIEEGQTVRLQPCKSPVWDTALVLRALSAAGVAADESSIALGVDWLLHKEAARHGDWARTVKAEPGGWYFEHHNEFYPDVDDTAMVLLALREQFSGPALPELVGQGRAATLEQARRQVSLLDHVEAAAGRGLRWLLAMQNRDGGWGAFDKDNDAEYLCHVPFADHNAMIDPSTPDLTGRALEALAAWGHRLGEKPVNRGVAYLRRTQEPDGSWYGRWGVHYIYGTWQVLAGLAAAGVPESDPTMAGGARWLLAHQQADGGWGESAASYDHPELRGQGKTTASQTAWALLGLIAAGQGEHAAVERGVDYLLRRQREDGGWDESEFTGTGFPRVFYLRYHYYPLYFPLLALAAARDRRNG